MNQEKRQCQNCKQDFTITPEDFRFYEKIQVPPPTWCFECRLSRRLNFLNERTFYKRTCNLCKKGIISVYKDSAIFPVYCSSCWHSDAWDSSQYARPYDFSKNFFVQFQELYNSVPHIALKVDNCQNCDYANQTADCKNCYLVSAAVDSENIFFGHRIINSRDSMDCLLLLRSELCFSSIECVNSARIISSMNCVDSFDMKFCYDAKGSWNCFMSSNIRHGTYIYENKKLSKHEFSKKMNGLDTGSYQKMRDYLSRFREIQEKSIHKFASVRNVENFIGDTATNVKNCFYCFNVSDLENCRYCFYVDKTKDSFDVNNGCCGMELVYEVCSVGIQTYDIKFSTDIWPEAKEIVYSDFCAYSSNLFGCVGLRNKRYCIFNKQYTPEEYKKMVKRIKEHMDEIPYIDNKGRAYKYGEFFPPELSPFAYNETAAQEYFPLTKKATLERGYSWKDPEQRNYKIQISNVKLPDHIKDVGDDMVGEIIECQHQGKCNEQCTEAFRIILPELKFYRKINLPLPRLCPNCRHYQRLKWRNPLHLWHRKCQCAGAKSGNEVYENTAQHFHGAKPCPNEFETSYSPERKEIVYCEKCYLAEVA